MTDLVFPNFFCLSLNAMSFCHEAIGRNAAGEFFKKVGNEHFYLFLLVGF